MNTERETLTVREISRILGCGLNQCYDGVRRGEIPAIRLGRRWLIPRGPFRRFLDQRQAQREQGQ